MTSGISNTSGQFLLNHHQGTGRKTARPDGGRRVHGPIGSGWPPEDIGSDVRDFAGMRILVATSNPGKLRDLAGAAMGHEIEIAGIPNFAVLQPVIEDGSTFEANARKKAQQYSLAAPEEIVVADDSGLEVDALKGAPGVHSARYAAEDPSRPGSNADDNSNNARLLRELLGVPLEKRTGRFVCVIAAARNGRILCAFRGVAEGLILDHPQGTGGFGYDPLFYFPSIQKTFAELAPEEKARYSHRGQALRKLLAWMDERKGSQV